MLYKFTTRTACQQLFIANNFTAPYRLNAQREAYEYSFTQNLSFRHFEISQSLVNKNVKWLH